MYLPTEQFSLGYSAYQYNRLRARCSDCVSVMYKLASFGVGKVTFP